MKAIVDGFTMVRLLAAAALFLAVGHWPYGYYQILRWAVCIISACGAYQAFQAGRKTWPWILVTLAVLFNPIAPIRFARATWAILDFLAALILLLSIPALRSRQARLK